LTAVPESFINYTDYIAKYYEIQAAWLNFALFGLAIVVAVIGIFSTMDYKSKKEEMDEIIKEAKLVILSNESQMKEDLKDVKAYVQKAKESENLSEANTKFSMGFSASKDKKYEQALKYFNKAIELNPKFGEAFYNRALVKFKLDNSDFINIIDDYKKATKLMSNNYCAQYNLTEAYIFTHNFKEGLETIKEYAKNPDGKFILEDDYDIWMKVLNEHSGEEFVEEIKQIINGKLTKKPRESTSI